VNFQGAKGIQGSFLCSLPAGATDSAVVPDAGASILEAFKDTILEVWITLIDDILTIEMK
jgi:hypothetical protein